MCLLVINSNLKPLYSETIMAAEADLEFDLSYSVQQRLYLSILLHPSIHPFL